MTETMETIHGIHNITPGANATTAVLVSVCFLYHQPLIIHNCRQSGVFPGMIPFNNVGRPQVLTTWPSTKITSN